MDKFTIFASVSDYAVWLKYSDNPLTFYCRHC